MSVDELPKQENTAEDYVGRIHRMFQGKESNKSVSDLEHSRLQLNKKPTKTGDEKNNVSALKAYIRFRQSIDNNGQRSTPPRGDISDTMNWENSQAQRVCDECFDGELPEMDEYAVLYLKSDPETIRELDMGETFRTIIGKQNPKEWWSQAKKQIDDELQRFSYEDIAESPTKNNQGLIDEEKVKKILEKEFGRLTKKKVVIEQGKKEFDLVSDDNQLVIEVKSYKFDNQTTKKAGYASTRKPRLIAACAYLDKVSAKRKMLVLTSEELHKQFTKDMGEFGMFSEVEIRYIPIKL